MTGLCGLGLGCVSFLTPVRIVIGLGVSKIGATTGSTTCDTAGSAKTGWACLISFSWAAIVRENCSGEKNDVGAGACGA